MTLAYWAEWTHPFIEAERTVGEGKRAGTEWQTKKGRLGDLFYPYLKDVCPRA